MSRLHQLLELLVVQLVVRTVDFTEGRVLQRIVREICQLLRSIQPKAFPTALNGRRNEGKKKQRQEQGYPEMTKDADGRRKDGTNATHASHHHN